MSPAIGSIEIVILSIAAIAAVLLGGFGSWSLVIVACFASAMLLTPRGSAVDAAAGGTGADRYQILINAEEPVR